MIGASAAVSLDSEQICVIETLERVRFPQTRSVLTSSIVTGVGRQRRTDRSGHGYADEAHSPSRRLAA